MKADQPNLSSSRNLAAVQPNWTACDSQTKSQHASRKQGVGQLSEVDHVPTNTRSSQGESQLYIFKENEAAIKMIIWGRSPTMRPVSRTHRVALDWLFDRINLEQKIQIKYVDTTNQLADILTEGSLSRDEWDHLLCLFNVMSFSTYSGSHWKVFSQSRERLEIGAMSKRGQDMTSSDGSPVAKARPSNLVLQGHCKEGVSSQGSGSPVNPVKDNNRQWVGLAQILKLKVPKRIDKRMLIWPQGTLGRKTKSEHKVKRAPPAQGNLMHHYPTWRTWDSLIIDTWERYSNAYRRNWKGLQ